MIEGRIVIDSLECASHFLLFFRRPGTRLGPSDIQTVMTSALAQLIQAASTDAATDVFLVAGEAPRIRHEGEVIITLEDPIEFIFQHSSCLIKQREIGGDSRERKNLEAPPPAPRKPKSIWT